MSAKELLQFRFMSTGVSLYADRETGQVYATANEMVDAYLARYASRSSISIAKLDDLGYSQFRKGSATIGINVLADEGVLLVLSPVLAVPKAKREALYRKLLEASFISTSDAAFAIDQQKEEVYVRALRRLSGLDYEELVDLVATVAEVSDEWDDRLKAEFGAA